MPKLIIKNRTESVKQAPLTSSTVESILYEQIGTEGVNKGNTFIIDLPDGGSESAIEPLPDLIE